MSMSAPRKSNRVCSEALTKAVSPCAGVSRLQELFNDLHEDARDQDKPLKVRRISVVRVNPTDSLYPLLRQVDRQFNSTDRNIVLDIGSVNILQSILNNVSCVCRIKHAPTPTMNQIRCHGLTFSPRKFSL